MKNKVIFSLVIFILLILSVIFTNSYVQALSKEEKWEIKNREAKNINCNYYCEPNENCPIYQENRSESVRQNNQHSHHNCNGRRNVRHQEGSKKNI